MMNQSFQGNIFKAGNGSWPNTDLVFQYSMGSVQLQIWIFFHGVYHVDGASNFLDLVS